VDETPPLREALDRLYRAPPSEFVRLRTELARSLAAGGDRETAQLLKTARKPDRIAAAVNQTVLDDSAAIEAVFAAYDEAEHEQRRGDPARWRDLVTGYRERVQEATRAIVEHAALPADGTISRRIAQALRAAAADDAARKRILAGRVTTLDQDTDPLAALGSTSGPIAPAKRREPAKQEAPPRKIEAAASSKRAKALAKQEAARAKRDEAARRKEERAEAARAKREEAERRRDAAARAKREAAAARAIEKATERVEALERERRRIDEALAKARADLARASSKRAT
jgi:hypothetical protein